MSCGRDEESRGGLHQPDGSFELHTIWREVGGEHLPDLSNRPLRGGRVGTREDGASDRARAQELNRIVHGAAPADEKRRVP